MTIAVYDQADNLAYEGEAEELSTQVVKFDDYQLTSKENEWAVILLSAKYQKEKAVAIYETQKTAAWNFYMFLDWLERKRMAEEKIPPSYEFPNLDTPPAVNVLKALTE